MRKNFYLITLSFCLVSCYTYQVRKPVDPTADNKKDPKNNATVANNNASGQKDMQPVPAPINVKEKLAANKVSMFNNGEIEIFKKLNFNAVFYGQVIAGSTMPNLMYLTSFENMADRDEHWKAFGPLYKPMSEMPKYQNNVSKNVTILCTPTDYSDY